MAPALQTLPPELLLNIISHLPSSTSFLPLSYTSTYLHLFFQQHAAIICNNHITTHHPLASTILLSHYSSTGWLLPTHPCVLAAEKRLLRDRILFSGCRCMSCQQILSSTFSSVSSSSTISIPETGGLLCFPSTKAATKNMKCKAGLHEQNLLRISEQGPQYLVFLERYGKEIQIRYEMMRTVRDMIGVVTSPNDVNNDWEEKNEGRREEERERFGFMVGNYCVRRFLGDVEKALTPRAAHEASKVSEVSGGVLEKGLERWNKLTASCRGLRKEKMEIKTKNKTENAPRLMFGEMPSAETVVINEKVAEKKREEWVDGLSWYYGFNSITGGVEQKGEEAKKKNGKIESFRNGIIDVKDNAGRVIKEKATKLGLRMKLVFRRCNGRDFESLEG